MMEARGLSRRFGGLLAVADVSLTLRPGELHAVIGPNGAGKSTLVNLLSGTLPPTQGQVWLDGRDVSALDASGRARAGVGRTFQRTNLMQDLSVFENARLAAQALVPMGSWLRRADRAAAPIAAAEAALRRVGVADPHVPVRTLSHGQQRQLEIAVALAGNPRVLLLDEPLAGTGPEDAAPIAELMRELSRDHAVLLIEHDMDVVFSVADVVTVMVDGRVLAQGTPTEIQRSDAVRDAYLGHGVA
jgi:branched-chain amino acid transport system ATP-binding protein